MTANIAPKDVPLIRSELPRHRGDVLWLIAALLACSLLRVWLIQHAEIIEPDGVVYVEAAKQWRADPGTMVDLFDIHPGFPVMICAADRVLGLLGQAGGPQRWELAGRCVGLVTSLAATLALWWFASMMFDRRIAWITALLMGVTRKWSLLGASVLTDAPAACLMLWAVAMGICVGRGLADRKRWALPAAAAIGVLAGGAFLVRPEGLFVLPTICVVWLAHAVHRRRGWGAAVLACGIAVLWMAACACPYVHHIDALTKRWPLPGWLGGGTPRAVAAELTIWGYAIWQIVPKFSERLHPLLTLNLGFWVLTWIVHRTRTSLPDAIMLFPKWDTLLAAGAWCVLFTPLIIARNIQLSEMSSRYVLMHAMLLCPLAGAGAQIVGEWAAVFLSYVRANYPLTRRIAVPVVAVFYATLLTWHAARPLHPGNIPLKTAGLSLRDRAAPGDFAFVRTRQVLIYTETPGHALKNDALASRDAFLTALATNGHAATAVNVYLVIAGQDVTGREEYFTAPAFERVETFPDADPANTVYVYKVDMRAITQALAQPASS